MASRAFQIASLLGGLGAAVALVVACDRVSFYSITGSSGGDTPSSTSGMQATVSVGTGVTPITRADMLDGVATCGESLLGDARAAAMELDAAAAALAAAPTAESVGAARDAWKKTMALVQQAEVLRFGPGGPVTLPTGEGLRDFVYSWPLVSRCLVEQNIVSQKYAAPTFTETGLVNMRGLAAAEYLLFYEGADNACSAGASINAQGTWAALGGDELASRKRAYGAVVSKDVAAKLDEIHGKWLGDAGFAAVLRAAGGSDSPFASDQAALNAVSDGIFYVEREVKDLKLGLPLGKTGECPDTCPEDVESLYASVSRDHVHNNLLGFERIFRGCAGAEGKGFDGLLRSVGAIDLADRMSADLDAAIAAVVALPSSDLGALLTTDRAAVDAVHVAIKRITDALKTDFVTILDLELPKGLEGDND